MRLLRWSWFGNLAWVQIKQQVLLQASKIIFKNQMVMKIFQRGQEIFFKKQALVT